MKGVIVLILFTGFAVAHEVNSVFKKIYEDVTEWRYQDNPEFASNVGDHRFTDQLEDYRPEAFPARKTAITNFLARLATLTASNRANLSPSELVSAEVLKNMLQTWLDGYEWRDYGPMNPINFLEGIQTNYDTRAGQVKFDSWQQFQKFAVRIRKYGDMVDQTIERMNRAIEKNTTLHAASMTRVWRRFDQMLAFENRATEFPMYVPYNATLDVFAADNNIPEANKTEIRDLAKANIDYLLAQARKLKEYINTTYMAHTRRDFGVHGLPRGREYYQACLKWQLSINITADEIHQLGLKEVQKVHVNMQNIVTRAGFKGTVQEYIAELNKRPEFYFNTSDQALTYFRNVHKTRLLPKMPMFFSKVPNYPLGIEPMSYDGPIGIYKNGNLDGTRPGTYYANVMNLDSKPNYGTVALMLHETDPGHHYQDAYALTATDMPDFRKVTDFSKYFAAPLHFPFYTAYSEGWALYAEDLGEQLEIYENDFERMGKYASEIFRAARLVVDTGIHDKGWTKEQAVEYMLNYTALSRSSVESEMDRYSTWPGQATSYTIGKIQIHQMRRKMIAQLCDHFDLTDFHRIMLENGAMPLSVLDRVLDNYIQKVKDQAAKDGVTVCSTNDATNHATSSIMTAVISMFLLSVSHWLY